MSENLDAIAGIWADEENVEEVEAEETEETEVNEESESKPDDELTDEEIIEKAKGKEGARTVSGRISKYKTEAEQARAQVEAERQARATIEQELAELRSRALQKDVAVKQMLKEFDIEADDPVQGLQTLLATHKDVTVDEIQKVFNEQVELQTAKEQVKAWQTQKEYEKRQEEERYKQHIRAEHFAAVKQAFPDLDIVQSAKSVDDFGQDFAVHMFAQYQRNKSADPVKAFRAVYVDEIVEHQKKAAKQAAYTNHTSKEHLRSTDGQAGNRVNVPKETYERYRMFFPDMTDEEIQKDFSKRNK